MGGAKRVVDEDISQLRQLLREGRVVGLFFGVKANVLQKRHVAWGRWFLDVEHHRCAKQLTQAGWRPASGCTCQTVCRPDVPGATAAPPARRGCAGTRA